MPLKHYHRCMRCGEYFGTDGPYVTVTMTREDKNKTVSSDDLVYCDRCGKKIVKVLYEEEAKQI